MFLNQLTVQYYTKIQLAHSSLVMEYSIELSRHCDTVRSSVTKTKDKSKNALFRRKAELKS